MSDYIHTLNRLYWQTLRHLAMTDPENAIIRMGVSRDDVTRIAHMSPEQFESLLNSPLPAALFRPRMRLDEITRDGARMRLLLAQDTVTVAV